MQRYPYILEMWYEEDAVLNSDGSWSGGKSEWRKVSRCNVAQNGQASQIALVDGTVTSYSFKVTMPPYIEAPLENTKVRVLTTKGYNIADGKHREISKVTYNVLSRKLAKQRYENTVLWL